MSDNTSKEFIDKEMGSIYSALWGDPISLNGVIPTNENAKGKVRSYCFEIKDVVDEFLIKKFGIKKENQECFREAFREACNGSGNEMFKILTLHSSSLCALLHFYLLASSEGYQDSPVILPIEGVKYKFTKAYFEFKNRVMSNFSAPSNVDVVLIGESTDDENDKAVLFLESKFTEYITGVGNKESISEKYRNPKECPYGSAVYARLQEKMPYDTGKRKDDKHFFLMAKEEKDKKCYLGGIKQIISHYVGIRNFINDIDKEADYTKDYPYSEVKNVINNGAKVYLGEILFSDWMKKVSSKDEVEEIQKYYSDYTSRIKQVAEVLNEILEDEKKELGENATLQRFEVLKKVHEYSEDWIREDELIRDFYYPK